MTEQDSQFVIAGQDGGNYLDINVEVHDGSLEWVSNNPDNTVTYGYQPDATPSGIEVGQDGTVGGSN